MATRLLLGGLLLLVALPAVARAGDAEEIRKLVPAASAMARKDFEKLASSEVAPRADAIEEKSLTLLLFAARPSDDAKAKEQFRFLTESVPKPSEIADEMYRGITIAGTKILSAPVTMIQANRITGLTCDIKDNTATGVVKFEVPKLYAGQAEYVARKAEGKWRIEEFRLPAYKIHVVLGKSGKWEQK